MNLILTTGMYFLIYLVSVHFVCIIEAHVQANRSSYRAREPNTLQVNEGELKLETLLTQEIPSNSTSKMASRSLKRYPSDSPSPMQDFQNKEMRLGDRRRLQPGESEGITSQSDNFSLGSMHQVDSRSLQLQESDAILPQTHNISLKYIMQYNDPLSLYPDKGDEKSPQTSTFASEDVHKTDPISLKPGDDEPKPLPKQVLSLRYTRYAASQPDIDESEEESIPKEKPPTEYQHGISKNVSSYDADHQLSSGKTQSTTNGSAETMSIGSKQTGDVNSKEGLNQMHTTGVFPTSGGGNKNYNDRRNYLQLPEGAHVNSQGEVFLEDGGLSSRPRVVHGLKKIDGENASPQQFPYIVYLKFRLNYTDGKNKSHKDEKEATGTIISPIWVITSLHIVPKVFVFIQLNPNRIETYKTISLEVDVEAGTVENGIKAKGVQKTMSKHPGAVWCHPKGKKYRDGNDLEGEVWYMMDVALVHLNTAPLTLDSYVAAIPLVAGPFPVNTFLHCQLVGFAKLKGAKTWKLHFAKTSTGDKNYCALLRGRAYSIWPKSYHVCALGQNGQWGCFGDSGSALVCDVNEIPTYVGVLNGHWTHVKETTVMCAEAREPFTHYVYCGAVNNWIKEVTTPSFLNAPNAIGLPIEGKYRYLILALCFWYSNIVLLAR